MTQNLTKEERMRQLLDAAVQVFGKKGYHDTQISDIIKKPMSLVGLFIFILKVSAKFLQP
ncbi:MAG: helix-turn-helix transcriptional regulator [Deltaproteobacteria bacterium]|nr:MAG: helix-turn-helix transcriptional regulator [Deltaproteobacteria bacterium]